MARSALDPDCPNVAVVSTKLSPADSGRLAELAIQAGITRSAFVREAVLDYLARADRGPPAGG